MSQPGYIQDGDFKITKLQRLEQEQPSLGKYGRMRKKCLPKYRPVLWNTMILSEKLHPNLWEVGQAVNCAWSR